MTQLQRFYAEYNQKYFNGRLPKDCKVVYEDLTKVKAIGHFCPSEWTAYDPESKKFKPYKTTYKIKICTRIKKFRRMVLCTLLHEMAHLSTDLKYPGRSGHGHYWQREMKRLANVGAFNGLW